MELKDTRKPTAEERKEKTLSKIVSCRTYPRYAKWMKKKEISPTRLFNAAIEELMAKEKKSNK